MSSNRLSAIVLAAGESSRMGQPKALLRWRGRPFIEHVCSALRAAEVEDRVVVFGRAASEILASWTPAGEKTAVNLKPENGQLSSLRAGLGIASERSEAFIVCLVDQPAILPETYKKIINFRLCHKDSIVIPRTIRLSDSRLKRGHPIIIPAAYRNLCFEGPLNKGLHWVIHQPLVNIADLDVADREIIRDFDTPEDYERLKVEGLVT